MPSGQPASIGTSLLKGLKSMGILVGGGALVGGAAVLMDPVAVGRAFADLPTYVPILVMAFQFLGTAALNWWKQVSPKS